VVNLDIREKPARALGELIALRILRPQVCARCGSLEFASQPVAVQVQQVAQLVEHPIEVVEYQRQSCKCADCGEVHIAARPENIVPGQDLGVSLQALLVWLGNYGHLPVREIFKFCCANSARLTSVWGLYKAPTPALQTLSREASNHCGSGRSSSPKYM